MRFLIVLLVLLLIPTFIFAEADVPDMTGNIFDAITEFFGFIVDLITGIFNTVKVLALDLIPALVLMLVSIFAFFGRLLGYVITFATIPSVPITNVGILQGLDFVMEFKILGFTLFGLVTTLFTFSVGFLVAKKLIL
ncbi:MAG: hypothetical protein GX367_03240 [Bacteroidales bacterium]|jgi:hypothetical protein|nr:hypothetical protein [Bacteroidales bacterium]